MTNKIKSISILILLVTSNVMAAPKAKTDVSRKAYERDYPIVFGTFEFADVEKESKDKYYEQIADFFEKNPSFAINEKMKTAAGVKSLMSIPDNWSKVYNYISQKCTEAANYKKCTELGDLREKILLETSSRPLITGASDDPKIDVIEKGPVKMKKKSSHTTQNDDGKEKE